MKDVIITTSKDHIPMVIFARFDLLLIYIKQENIIILYQNLFDSGDNNFHWGLDLFDLATMRKGEDTNL